MNKQLLATILLIGLISSTNASAAFTCCVTTSVGCTNDGYYTSPAHSACASSGTCLSTFSEAQWTAAAGTIAGNCDFCATSGNLLRVDNTCSTTCATSTYIKSRANQTCGTTCDTAYTDSTTGADPSNVAGNCHYCKLSTAVYDRPPSRTDALCTLKTGGSCSTGYGFNTAGDQSNPTTNCTFCAANYNFNSILNTTCVLATANCADGYLPVNASASKLATADCYFCDNANSYYWTSPSKVECGKTCVSGWQTSTGKNSTIDGDCTVAAPEADTTNGSILTFSVLIIFSLLSILI